MSSNVTKSVNEGEAPSLWNLPGLDKETFYAAALYLHAAAKGQLRDPSEHVIRHETKTDENTRDFLDRLADCFARSKSEDPSAHVTATAMVIERNLPENTRITVYITKNHSEKGFSHGLPDKNLQLAENQNRVFADTLFAWFNSLADDKISEASDYHSSRSSCKNEILGTMYKFNQSRLEYYIKKIADMDQESMDITLQDEEAWIVARGVIDECKAYQSLQDPGKDTADGRLSELAKCAHSAAACRSNDTFQNFNQNADGLFRDDSIDEAFKDLARLAKWVNYLGKFAGAYDTFYEFCTMEQRHGCSYQYVLLSSPEEEGWPTNVYTSKVESWTGYLGLNDERKERKTVRTILGQFVAKAGSRGTARVHCEIQLLRYFTQPGAKPCLDYFGCSKKSCWLCWKLIRHYGNYTTKESHHMIYPMWAFPSDFSPSQLEMARALSATYNDMLCLIQDKILNGTDFSSRINITHTSPRLDRRILKTPTPEISSSQQLLSTESLRAQGRVPFASVPVVHIPAATGETELPSPRMIDMDLFEVDESDKVESHMEPSYIGDNKLVFACQLNTKLEQRTISIQEYQSSFWTSDGAISSDSDEFDYRLLYRTDDEQLQGNPWLLDQVKGAHNLKIEQDMIPWREDVFIFAFHRKPNNMITPDFWPQLWLGFNAVRLNVCISRLKEFLSGVGPIYYATIKYNCLDWARKRVRRYNTTIWSRQVLEDVKRRHMLK